MPNGGGLGSNKVPMSRNKNGKYNRMEVRNVPIDWFDENKFNSMA